VRGRGEMAGARQADRRHHENVQHHRVIPTTSGDPRLVILDMQWHECYRTNNQRGRPVFVLCTRRAAAIRPRPAWPQYKEDRRNSSNRASL
jgi:hypothetical protein